MQIRSKASIATRQRLFVRRIDELSGLVPYRERWDKLAAGRVFSSWTWLSTWWPHYGEDDLARELHVLLVFEDPDDVASRSDSGATAAVPESDAENPERLIAILPCYIEETARRGRVLRMLGDGEVCSDYLDLLVDEEKDVEVAEFLADYLCRRDGDWDLLEITTIEGRTAALTALVSALRARGCRANQRSDYSCWSVSLPETWEELIADLSKKRRNQLRRVERGMLESGDAAWHLVESRSDFEAAWPILVDLHQRRFQSLGGGGSFSSQRWASFLEDVSRRLLDEGRLRLSWLEVDSAPIAVEYGLAGPDTTFAYQGGVDPDRLDKEPGHYSLIRTVQHAIEEGQTRFDLLRGDFPYKQRWRAEPSLATSWKIVAPRLRPRLHYRIQQARAVIRRVKKKLSRIRRSEDVEQANA